MFDKARSIKVSERVLDLVTESLDEEVDGHDVRIAGFLDCFNNCREQGYVLRVLSNDWENPERTKGALSVWVCEYGSSDDIMVVYHYDDDCSYASDGGRFSEEDCEHRRYRFDVDDYVYARNFILDVVRQHFASEFERRKDY